MRKQLLLLCLICVCSCSIFSQQLPLFSQYRENQSLINPATVHADNLGMSFHPNNSVGITYRRQWAGFKDAPTTMTGRYEHIFEDQSFLGGLALIKDEMGPNSTSGAYLRYAYQAYFSKYSYLSIGVAGGLVQQRFVSDKGTLRQAGDFIGEQNYSVSYTDFSIGIFYSAELDNDDVFYTGLSVPQIGVLNLTKEEELQVNKVPHFYGQIGMYKYLGDGFASFEGTLFLEPSLWVKFVPGVGTHLDGNLRFQMTDAFWIGGGYSVGITDKFRGNQIMLEGGMVIGEMLNLDDKLLKIGYGFGKTITQFGPRLGNTHEINLTYSFSSKW